MEKQYISIDNAWSVLLCYDVWTEGEIRETLGYMQSLGASDEQIRSAAETLGGLNGGVTFSSFGDRMSLMAVGHADSFRQFFNTIDHEIDHVQDHVALYYGVILGTEQAAYLQGYIGGRIWEFIFNLLRDR